MLFLILLLPSLFVYCGRLKVTTKNIPNFSYLEYVGSDGIPEIIREVNFEDVVEFDEFLMICNPTDSDWIGNVEIETDDGTIFQAGYSGNDLLPSEIFGGRREISTADRRSIHNPKSVCLSKSSIKTIEADCETAFPGSIVGASGDYCLMIHPHKTEMTFQNAESYCISKGGHLVSVHSANENAIVKEMKDRGGIFSIWLGFNDERVEGVWEWTDGTPTDYSNWLPGEPNDNLYNEDFAHMVGGNGQWNDMASGYNVPLCKVKSRFSNDPNCPGGSGECIYFDKQESINEGLATYILGTCERNRVSNPRFPYDFSDGKPLTTVDLKIIESIGLPGYGGPSKMRVITDAGDEYLFNSPGKTLTLEDVELYDSLKVCVTTSNSWAGNVEVDFVHSQTKQPITRHSPKQGETCLSLDWLPTETNRGRCLDGFKLDRAGYCFLFQISEAEKDPFYIIESDGLIMLEEMKYHNDEAIVTIYTGYRHYSAAEHMKIFSDDPTFNNELHKNINGRLERNSVSTYKVRFKNEIKVCNYGIDAWTGKVSFKVSGQNWNPFTFYSIDELCLHPQWEIYGECIPTFPQRDSGGCITFTFNPARKARNLDEFITIDGRLSKEPVKSGLSITISTTRPSGIDNLWDQIWMNNNADWWWDTEKLVLETDLERREILDTDFGTKASDGVHLYDVPFTNWFKICNPSDDAWGGAIQAKLTIGNCIFDLHSGVICLSKEWREGGECIGENIDRGDAVYTCEKSGQCVYFYRSEFVSSPFDCKYRPGGETVNTLEQYYSDGTYYTDGTAGKTYYLFKDLIYTEAGRLMHQGKTDKEACGKELIEDEESS